MLAHMLYHAMDITKVTDMTELVYLIMADGLEFQLLLNILQVVAGGCDGCNTGTREADF